MKIVIFGNHTCANRGDSAILRGLITGIESRWPDAKISIRSRFPSTATALLGREVDQDVFFGWHEVMAESTGRRTQASLRWAIPLVMACAIRTGWKWLVKLLPDSMGREIDSLREYDIAIQVGGSFFVDLYGPVQFGYPFAAILAERPLLLLGHSMGPFGKWGYRWLVSTLLEHARDVVLREPVSLGMIRAAHLPTQRISMGSDTAWLVRKPAHAIDSAAWLPSYQGARPLIGITVRDISRFGQRMGTSQGIYESAFVALVDTLIDRGYDVAAFSTCTPLGGYHSDDGQVARRIAASIKVPGRFHIAQGEPDDIQLGQLLASCELVVSTRLHGAIIALNFGVPAIAISYEHKSDGIMKQLGLGQLAHPVESLIDGSTAVAVLRMLDDPGSCTPIVEAVEAERQRARTMIDTIISRAWPD